MHPDVAAALRPARAGSGSPARRAATLPALWIVPLWIRRLTLVLADRLALGLALLILSRILVTLILVGKAAHARLPG